MSESWDQRSRGIGRQLRLVTNGMEIGRCVDNEKNDGRALSACTIIDEGLKEENMLKTVDSDMNVEEVHKDGDHEDMDAKLQEALGMICLVLPWTRRKSDGRG